MLSKANCPLGAILHLAPYAVLGSITFLPALSVSTRRNERELLRLFLAMECYFQNLMGGYLELCHLKAGTDLSDMV